MDDENENRVGYKNPPKSGQFKRGECRNPNGRRGKIPKVAQKPSSDADILKEIEAEKVDFNGKTITKREARLRVLQAKAMKGDVRASQIIEKLMDKAALEAMQRTGGVLVIPEAPSYEVWAERTKRQQAQYREQIIP